MSKRREQKYIFDMMRSALNGQPLKEVPAGLDWEYIRQVCQFHRIENLAAYGMQGNPQKDRIPKHIQKSFVHACQKGMAREAVQKYEQEQILEGFEKAGVDSLPLKGSVLKNYYPSPDMRFLTDLDILFRDEHKEDVRRVLLGLGYQEDHEWEVHDVYIKPPVMNVEMHYICCTQNKELNQFYETIWERAWLIEGKECTYQMSWEDYYIYMVGHAVRHFKLGGIGIRMLLDFVVFEEKLEGMCDRRLVEEELQRAGLLTFEKSIRAFLKDCMEEGKPLNEKDGLLDCVIESGAYGTMDNFLQMRLLEGGDSRWRIFITRLKLLASVVLPDMGVMKELYPYLEHYPLLLPAAWIQRGIQKALFAPGQCRRVLMDVLKRRQLDDMKGAFRKAGFHRGGRDGTL